LLPLVDFGPLNDSECLDWLRLSRNENVGPITFFALLERYGGAAPARGALPELTRSGGRKCAIKLFSRSAAHQGAIESGTLAVMDGGVDVAYPKQNAARFTRISWRAVW